MTAQPYADAPKTVVIHCDDLGMTHAANAAFGDLAGKKICSAGSAMAPCPWFPEICEMAAADRSLDIGVHLTLNSEMVRMRWRPLTTPRRSAGLTDDAGYCTVRSSWCAGERYLRLSRPSCAPRSMRLFPPGSTSHTWTHCGTIMAPEFVDIYVRLGRDYGLPVVLATGMERYFRESFSGPPPQEVFAPIIEEARRRGEPIFDRLLETSWKRGPDIGNAYRVHFDKIPAGLTYMMFHFTRPGADFEAVDPETAYIRTDEYALFASGAVEPMFAERGLTLVGMRGIRDRLRAQRVSTP